MLASGVAGLMATPALHPGLLDLLNDPVQMDAGFGLDGDQVSARFGEGRNEAFWGLNHQVHIKR